MISEIKCLPIHPLPRPEDSISSWIKDIATANMTQFLDILRYISKFSRDYGLVNTLNDLTKLSIEQISKLNNDINSEFWKYPNQCPIKKCSYKTKKNSILMNQSKIQICYKLP